MLVEPRRFKQIVTAVDIFKRFQQQFGLPSSLPQFAVRNFNQFSSKTKIQFNNINIYENNSYYISIVLSL